MWGKVWVDQNITFCGDIQKNKPDMESKLPVVQGLKPFVSFSKVLKTI